jgi:ATP-dependent Zn protease
MPNSPSRNKLSPFVRTLLFWSIIIALAFVWQATRSSMDNSSSQQLSYSNFLQQVENHNISTATLVVSQNTAEVHGNLREPAREYRTSVPKDSASDLTEPLRNAGVAVNVSQMPAWTDELLNFAPLLTIIGLGILFVMMKWIRGRQAPRSA